eukprot:TRINITY_DN1436_c0_g1_i2.p1 TRINITY_DN1436_c0_g1~~TRINITY_DN1436_c0_g1_i2.p1  ORF type:complete len:2696 (+),score=879.69 TRINITY_DN1436_c0_g1_i2:238-8325(+)
MSAQVHHTTSSSSFVSASPSAQHREPDVNDEKLIPDLIARIGANIHRLQKSDKDAYQTSDQISLDNILLNSEEEIVRLSAYKLPAITSSLTDLLESLNKKKDTESLSHTMALLARCMAFQWDHIKAQYRNVQGLNEREAILLKEKQEQILPPPLEDLLARRILEVGLPHLSSDKPSHQHNAGSLLFQLSASNYEVVFSKILETLHTISIGKESEDVLNQLMLLEYFNLNSKRLSELVDRINKYIAHFRKERQQLLLAQTLRKAIWNWIGNYPMEFVGLCQSGARLPGPADQIFDIVDGWAKKASVKNVFWPVQTMLFILCPDVMLKVILNKEKTNDTTLKEKFLESLKSALKTGKVADAAAVCYVDICKAATFVSKSDMSALRYLVPSIELELRERLFDPKGDRAGSDVDLMTDCLVALFRISPRKALSTLFPDCIVAEAPLHFKMVLVKGLLRIVQEGDQLPWTPTISEVYATMCGPLRVLFLDFVQSARSYGALKTATDKKSKAQFENVEKELEILTLLIKLFHHDPTLALSPLPSKTAAQTIENTRSIMSGLSFCSSFFAIPELYQSAAQALLSFHTVTNIERWAYPARDQAPQTPSTVFWEVEAAVNTGLASALIEQRDIKTSEIQHLVTLVEEILIRRNAFLERSKDLYRSLVNIKDVRLQGIARLEQALLIHLCCGETDICSKAATCFGLLCDEIDILGQMHVNENDSIVMNYTVYRKLSTAGVLQTGRQHQQRVIRNLLRRTEAQSTGNFAAWEEVLVRWKEYTPVLQLGEEIEKARKLGTLPSMFTHKSIADIKQEWQNYLGFLCALSTVALGKETTVRVQEKPSGLLRKAATNEKVIKVIDPFLTELVGLVTSDDAFIRETIMAVSGVSFSPASFPVLFSALGEEVRSFFGDAGQFDFNPRSILFVDQAIGIVKHILEMPHEADDLSLITSFESLILLFVKFVSQLVINSVSFRIKKNLCALLEVMMTQRQYISFLRETEFRNTLVDAVMEWTSDFVLKSGGTLTSSMPDVSHSSDYTSVAAGSSGSGQLTTSGSIKPLGALGNVASLAMNRDRDVSLEAQRAETALARKLLRELDVACISAIASLLRGLALPQGPDPKENKFGKYFTFFTTLLTRCKQDKDSPPLLAECAIKALSNLLSANIHSGLEYFVSMGFHEDHETRTAFLRVISNILNQGTEFDLGDTDKYAKLTELLLDSDLSLVTALGEITQVTEADQIAAALIRLFESNDKSMMLVRRLIMMEMNKTESVGTLFRSNSMATKVLSAYFKLIGNQYLEDGLLPAFQEFFTIQGSFELDPTRVGPNHDMATATVNVKRTIQIFMDAIVKAATILPTPFREVSNCIHRMVAEKFPGHERIAVGGIMFLRYMCPAILAPEGFGLLGSGVLTPEQRRGLVLATKVLQNLANGISFSKEGYMVGINSFVQELQKPLNDVIDNYTVLPANIGMPSSSTGGGSGSGGNMHVTEEQHNEDMALLHHHMTLNLEKLNKTLAATDRETYERLGIILQRLGKPSDMSMQKKLAGGAMSRAPASPSKGSNFYEEFMQAHGSKNTDAIKQKKIYYKHGVNKDKHPVYYYVARRFEKNIDMELLLLHILKTTQESFAPNSPFVLVIDTTLAGTDHQIALPWCAKYMRHFPETAGSNLKTIFVVNPNHTVKKYANRIKALLGRAGKKVVFLPSAARLFEYISEPEQGLPSSTLAVETDIKATFSPVMKMSGQYHIKEVVLRISTDLLQLVTVKQHPVLGKATNLIDLYHISTVHEVTHSSEDHEFVIKYESGGQKAMTLRSTASQQIIQALKASRARWTLSRPEKVSSRVFRPSDVPGTLLNVALLNLGSNRNALRVAAYNMLSALCHNSNFSIKLQLLETDGMCIPRNNSQFVQRVSEKLAHSETGLTLEFLTEAMHSITKTTQAARALVLEYIAPWVPNLALFCVKPVPGASSSQTPGTPTPGMPGPSVTESPEKFSKAVEVINSLIDLTIREPALKTSVLTHVWQTIGKVDATHLIVRALKCCTKKAQEAGFGHPTVDVIGDIITTMAAQNPQLVAGKLIAKLLKALDAPCKTPVVDMAEHERWPKVCVYTRLLFLISFDNLVCVHLFLADLLHIVLQLFSTGAALMRATVHALLINIAHSLYTSLVSPENKLQSLHFHLAEFGQPSFRLLFGMSPNSYVFSGETATPPPPTPPPSPSLSLTSSSSQSNLNATGPGGPSGQLNSGGLGVDPRGRDQERMPIMNVEPVAASIYGVLNCSSPLGNSLGTPFHARWLSLNTATALGTTPALQARAFITLGAICKSQALVSDFLIEQVLTTLRGVISNSKCLTDNNDLFVAIISCLTKLFEYLPVGSKFTKPLFWVAMTFVQIYETRVFTASITLLEVMIKTMDNNESFKDYPLAKSYMTVRQNHPIQPILNKLDAITGISFESNFSFAVAAHLLKGLRHPSTKTATARLANTFLNITMKRLGVGPEILGYLAALLPTDGDTVNIDPLAAPVVPDATPVDATATATSSTRLSLTTPAASGGSAGGGVPRSYALLPYLSTEQMVPNQAHAALLFTLMVTMLVNTDREHEQLFIYEALRRGINFMPAVFPVVYKVLIPKMSTLLSSCQNDKIMEIALAIMDSMFSFTLNKAQKLNVAFLRELGFHGFLDLNVGFKAGTALNDSILRLSSELINCILTAPAPPAPTPTPGAPDTPTN